MSFLVSLASLLETSAVLLRRAAEPKPDVVEDGSIPAPLPTKPLRGPSPEGFWRCTHSKFDDFVVGKAYLCTRKPTTSCLRIRPYAGSTWAPYWSDHEGRFCYPSNQLDFVFLGTTLPEGEQVDARTREERIAERASRNAGRLAQAA